MMYNLQVNILITKIITLIDILIDVFVGIAEAILFKYIDINGFYFICKN